MSRLMRTSEIIKRPVVSRAGEDVAQIKDIIYTAGEGAVAGFTLAGRGIFAGPLPVALPWASVTALGNDAVMISDQNALKPLETLITASRSEKSASGNVLGARVLTDGGTDLGVVVDVIVQVGRQGPEQCDVVGYEIESAGAESTQAARMLIPLPDTLAASGEHLIVPASAIKFVRHDLAGFGAAIEEFRAHLEGQD